MKKGEQFTQERRDGTRRFVEVCGSLRRWRGGDGRNVKAYTHTHTYTDTGAQGRKKKGRKRKCRRAGGCSQPAVPSAADRFIEWHVPIRSNVVLCLPLSYPARGRFARRENYYRLCFTLETFALSLQTLDFCPVD